MKNLTLLLIINILFATQLFADTTTTNITPHNYIDSSIIAKQSGNYQESINYIKKAILLQDTLYNHNYNNEIKILRSSSEIEELYVENKVQKNRILTIIILFASIHLSVFVTISARSIPHCAGLT